MLYLDIGCLRDFRNILIGLVVLKLNVTILQPFSYLKLSVAGHLTVFVARTRDHFWIIKPAKQLLLAVVLTQLTATFTVYGILLPAMGWGLALFVWGYAFLPFLVTDFLKVYFYKVLDHTGIKFHK